MILCLNDMSASKTGTNLYQNQNLTSAQFDKSFLSQQSQNMYIVSAYCFVLITLGFILIKSLYELKSCKDEKKDAK